MRRLFAASLILISSVVAIASQGQPPSLYVLITDQGRKTSESIEVQKSAFYLGAPSAWIVASATPGSRLDAGFGVRAWKENGKARIVVFAVLHDQRSPANQTETPIATFALAVGESVEVKEAQAWGAHLTVGAVAELPR